MSNQSSRQQDNRDATGTSGTLNEDWLARFDTDSIASGTFEERQLMWLNGENSVTDSNLSVARTRYAVAAGFDTWNQVNALTAAVLPDEITFTSFTATELTTIVIPAGANIGDLVVLVDCARKNSSTTIPTNVLPTGFTQINTTGSSAATSFRTSYSYKILEAGDPGATVTGMDDSSEAKTLLLFTGNSAYSTVTPAGILSEGTTGDPASQTILSGAGTPPLVAIAHHMSNSGPGTAEMDPAADGTQDISGPSDSRTQYKIYNESPANIVWDCADEGANNIVVSFYLEVTFA